MISLAELYGYIFMSSLIITIITLIYASIQDWKYRRVLFTTWVPMIIVGFISSCIFIYLSPSPLIYIITIPIQCGIFYYIAKREIIGGADAYCLIFIALTCLQSPYSNVGNGWIGILTFVNAIILMILFTTIITFILSFSINFKKSFYDILNSFKIPFIIYITIGFLITLFIGFPKGYII